VKSQSKQGFYEFLNLQIDLQKRRLMCGEDVISLTPKEFELLILLVENAGKIVEKDELLEKIWHDTFVEEATLARNISWLRKKLANYTGEVRIIETLPKRGYRFLPEVKINLSDQLFIQEETIQEFEIQESIEILPSNENNEISIIDGKIVEIPKTKLLPEANVKPTVTAFGIITILLVIGSISLIIYYFYFSAKPNKIIQPIKIMPFTGLNGREDSPNFSPDGKQIVYTWDGGEQLNNTDIYLKQIGLGEPIKLTNSPQPEINPVFSPDGNYVAFVRIFPNHNEIILIPALGGAERKIYDKASYASLSFSPDGKFLAHANLDLSNNNAGIFLINIETGETKQITTPQKTSVDLSPRFSPDGKKLAFIHYFDSFYREIFVVSSEGGEPLQITFDKTQIFDLAWNYKTNDLVFSSSRQGNQINLWEISTNNKSEPQLISINAKGLFQIAVSPKNDYIAFVNETSDANIVEINENGNSKSIISSTVSEHSQQFSPDGKKIVFASERTGNYEIWIADADGKNQRQLTNTKNSSGSPRFSPDGKFIAYDSQKAGSSDIYVVSTDGGESIRLTENSNNNFLPSWKSDGSQIFFISNRSGSEQIWKISATGGEATQITKNGGFEMYVVNDSIIYSKGSNKAGLWSIGINGENENPIPELSEVGIWRSWFANNKGIYFTANNNQPPYQIKFFDFKTKTIKDIAKTEKPPLQYYSNLNVSPDEKRILYAQEDKSSSQIELGEFKE
jgi:Tol biopolymer transport system component/DNA-binding winged helix-turn-helix (wHTH) protein